MEKQFHSLQGAASKGFVFDDTKVKAKFMRNMSRLQKAPDSVKNFLNQIDAQQLEGANKAELSHATYEPIAKLILPGSGRVITPYPLDKHKSWLEESPQIHKEYTIDTDTLEHLVKVFNFVMYKPLIGRLPLLIEEKDVFEDSSISPVSLYGRIEDSGVLSVLAFFTDDDGDITRTEHSTVSHFEVDWVETPLLTAGPKSND